VNARPRTSALAWCQNGSGRARASLAGSVAVVSDVLAMRGAVKATAVEVFGLCGCVVGD